MADEALVYDGLQACPYLPGQVARMPLFRQRRRLSGAEADARFANSERRVGRSLYRTACPTCKACQGLRVLTAEFAPSKSQRRVLARWEGHGRVEIGPVRVDPDRIELYNRHKFGRDLAEPDDAPMDLAGYAGWLADSCLPTLEMAYYYDDMLVGVGVVDVGEKALSSVYFYFDPARSDLSPGVYSVMQEIDLCRRTGRPWLYLGLYVADCASLAYKANYRPHERFRDGDWRRES